MVDISLFISGGAYLIKGSIGAHYTPHFGENCATYSRRKATNSCAGQLNLIEVIIKKTLKISLGVPKILTVILIARCLRKVKSKIFIKMKIGTVTFRSKQH
jgi:hypothetical protein